MKLRILSHGTDGRTLACAATLTRLAAFGDVCAAHGIDSVQLLPIPSTADGRHVAETDTPLLSLCSPHTLLVGHALPAAVCEAQRAAGGRTCDVAEDEIFTADNARLTAVGTVGYLLTHLPCAPEGAHIGVLGYGRIGRELCRLLLFLGASVRVFSGKEHVRHMLGACGLNAAPYPAPHEAQLAYADLDVLINTAPADGLIPDGVCVPTVIDLASGRHVASSVPHVRLPSLPSRMFPIRAGEVYAAAVLRAVGASAP